MMLLDFVGSITILSFLICINLYSLTYPLETRLFPLLVGVPATIAMLTHILREGYRLAQLTREQPIPKQRYSCFKSSYGLIREICWMVGYLTLIYFLGFFVSTILFLFLYLRLSGFSSFRALGVAGVLAAANYLFFDVLMKMTLFPGIIYILLTR